MEIFYDQEEFVVVDIGSGFIKAGFSGEDLPRVVIPTAVAEKIEVEEEATVNPSGQPTESRTKITSLFGNKALN